MIKDEKIVSSSALDSNLGDTSVSVTILKKHKPLIAIVKDSYGIHKRTKEFLEELNNPHIDWESAVEKLRTISLADFHHHNSHPNGGEAIRVVTQIYLDLISQTEDPTVKETGIDCLFDYIQQILSDSGKHLSRNLPSVFRVFDFFNQISRGNSYLLKKKSKDLKSILTFLTDHDIAVDVENLQKLFYRVFNSTYGYWLNQPNPEEWIDDSDEDREALVNFKKLIYPLSHVNLKTLLGDIEEINQSVHDRGWKAITQYLQLPDYYQILNGYLRVADELERSDAYRGRHHYARLNFLFKIFNIDGLSDIHREALIEINRSLGRVFTEKPHQDLNEFVKKIFYLLKQSSSCRLYPDTTMHCITTVAKEIFKLNDHQLADTFIEQIILFGFQSPDIQGITTDWEVKFNLFHVQNIRSWLEIISMNPRWTKRLLSALIINLKIGGVFVRDTDLLQKDISALLNSDTSPSTNLIMQLNKLLPVFFNEIGAEGELRDISTKMDEVSFRQDRLIHFLRKQSHVESSSTLVTFVEGIFQFWNSRNKNEIREYLPDEIYQEIDNSGEYFDGMHKIFKTMMRKADQKTSEFLEWDESKVQKTLQEISDVPERDKERTVLLLKFYKLIHKKYYIGHLDLIKDLESSSIFERTKINSLQAFLQRRNYYKSLVILIDFLNVLKRRILSSKKTEPFENIYRKRHIAAGIASMYGTYSEEKFEALGLSFRLQSLATVLFEEMINDLNHQFITKRTLTEINKYLWLFIKALQLEGIATEGLESKMKYFNAALKIKRFSIDQYIDIFRFLSKSIQDITRVYYIDAHQANLPVIIKQCIEKKQQEWQGTLQKQDDEAVYEISEKFTRSMIASAFVLQTLDNFISNIIGTLNAEYGKFKERRYILNILMSYNPDITIRPIHTRPHKDDDQVILGNKGYFLKQLASFNFPVPPGFIITTEVFRCLEAVLGYGYIIKDLNERIDREIVKVNSITGKRFGDPENPLLFSVRSGAAISLPGMMGSFLNVGINEEIAEGLSKKEGYGWAAWDSYRRFLQAWGMYEGLNRNFFDEIIDYFKIKHNILKKLQFAPDQMKEIALVYKQELLRNGIDIEDDPRKQLGKAILKVLESWNSYRAKLYRQELDISDEWGTAVIVQTMVFGNLNERSGSGVVFTRDPKGFSTSVTLNGDFIFGIQGDDIVSGLVDTYPISEVQRETEKRNYNISLEKDFPEVFAKLKEIAEVLIYEKKYAHQEIEFTFVNDSKEGIYILQTRDMSPMESTGLRHFSKSKKLEMSLLGVGIGVGGGAICGKIVFSEEEIKLLRKKEPETQLILIRPDTVPEDIGLIRQVDGLLTAKGGSTSHAAVTIPQFKKVGVVGLQGLRVYEQKGFIEINKNKLKGGDFISIDGWSGAVYLGKHRIKSTETSRVKI